MALRHDAGFSHMRLSDVDWADRHASGVRLESVRLLNGDLSDARLERLRLDECELTRCNLANVEGRSSQATRDEGRIEPPHGHRVP